MNRREFFAAVLAIPLAMRATAAADWPVDAHYIGAIDQYEAYNFWVRCRDGTFEKIQKRNNRALSRIRVRGRTI